MQIFPNEISALSNLCGNSFSQKAPHILELLRKQEMETSAFTAWILRARCPQVKYLINIFNLRWMTFFARLNLSALHTRGHGRLAPCTGIKRAVEMVDLAVA